MEERLGDKGESGAEDGAIEGVGGCVDMSVMLIGDDGAGLNVPMADAETLVYASMR